MSKDYAYLLSENAYEDWQSRWTNEEDVPLDSTPTIAGLRTAYRRLHLHPVRGYTDRQLDYATQQLADEYSLENFKLPAALREFLHWAGQSRGDLFLWTTFDSFELVQLRGQVESSLLYAARSLRNKDLPRDAVVFLNNKNSKDYWFVVASEGDDPPIYSYSPTATEFKQVYAHFTQSLAAEIDKQAEWKAKYQVYKTKDGLVNNTNYLNNAKRLWQSFNLPTPSGCTSQQLYSKEEEAGFSFPDAYREFLLWLGKPLTSRPFFRSVGLADYSTLILCRHFAVVLLLDNSQLSLPDDSFVFWSEIGESFIFMRLAEGDNPPVYSWNKTNPDSFEQISPNFSTYVEEQIALYAKNQQQNK